MGSGEDLAKANSANEERRAPRQRVLLTGLLTFSGGFVSCPCRVRNISETGALLLLDNLFPVPSQFTLHVPVGGFRVECKRVWTEGLGVGVHFIGEREASVLHNDQFVKPCEQALSQTFQTETERRERASSAEECQIEPSRPAQPAFGKRS